MVLRWNVSSWIALKVTKHSRLQKKFMYKQEIANNWKILLQKNKTGVILNQPGKILRQFRLFLAGNKKTFRRNLSLLSDIQLFRKVWERHARYSSKEKKFLLNHKNNKATYFLTAKWRLNISCYCRCRCATAKHTMRFRFVKRDRWRWTEKSSDQSRQEERVSVGGF